MLNTEIIKILISLVACSVAMFFITLKILELIV